MPDHIFVGRENELRQLQHLLDEANAARAQIVFIAGEAGAGKSTLVQEFVRRAQETDAEVVAAIGECNAQTGAGDAYLPFRQVLTALTGAPEDKASAQAVSTTNSARLKEFVRVSGETLLEVGPDLVGIFVPGASLFVKLATKAATHSKWADTLREQLGKPEKPGVNPALDQEKILEQYTNVLQALAQEHTLILILDDLQWADSASLNLLFHLARQLKASRVLLVGAYRPDDVALGRGGERHPLEPILNELKRYNGDIVIDLGATRANEGRAFVDALVDAEPNRLDERFRAELFARTGGHPLFAVELLRNLQERGDLVRDAKEEWIQKESLDWNALPARVEGVIEERLARLAENLREDLTVASVMGVDFVAQVIARVQQVPERELVKQLARELDKRHRLVEEQGEVRVGKLFLTQYRFTHALFQQFLYNELRASERRILHGEVGNALEALYEGQAGEMAVQLARHFEEAGDDSKTMEYSLRAAEAARQIYAFPEARGHFARALEALKRLPDTEEYRRRHIDAIFRYVEVAWGAFVPQELFGLISEAETLVRSLRNPDGTLADPLRLAQIHNRLTGLYLARNDNGDAIRYARQGLDEASLLEDKTLVATASCELGWGLVSQGHFEDAQPYLVQAITLLEETPDHWEWFDAVAMLGITLAMRGQVAAGLAEGQRALARMEATKNHNGITQCRTFLLPVYLERADMSRLLEECERTVEVAVESDMALYASLGLGFKALAQSRLGQHEDAQKSMAAAREFGAKVGSQFTLCDWIAAANAELAYHFGAWEQAITRAEQASAMAQSFGGIFAQGWSHRVWAQALVEWQPAHWDQAEVHFAASLRLFEEGGAALEAARTRVAWGQVLHSLGNADAAREHFEKAAAQFEASGLTGELQETKHLIDFISA